MLRFRKITSLVVLSLMLAFTISCSEEDEVLEQQEPQSQINTKVADFTTSSTQNAVEVSTFTRQTNWYQNLDPSDCGIDAILLAYEVFDDQGNSLNQTDITGWTADAGLSLEFIVDDLNSALDSEFGQDVNIVFVSGILIKAIDDSSFEFAEVNSYTYFEDYFSDCSSDDVVFNFSNGTPEDWFMEVPEPQDDVEFPDTPCLSLEFPLDLLVADESNPSETFEITVVESEFLDYISGNVPNIVVINFVYPLNTISSDGTVFTVNNEVELEQLYEQECE